MKVSNNTPSPSSQKRNIILPQPFQPGAHARERCALKTRLRGLTESKLEFTQDELLRYKVPERAASLMQQERATLSSTPNCHLPNPATSTDWGQQQPIFHPHNLLHPLALNGHTQLQGLVSFPLPQDSTQTSSHTRVRSASFPQLCCMP